MSSSLPERLRQLAAIEDRREAFASDLREAADRLEELEPDMVEVSDLRPGDAIVMDVSGDTVAGVVEFVRRDSGTLRRIGLSSRMTIACTAHSEVERVG